VTQSYVPDRGDVVWINLSPRAGHERAGHRPALVISPGFYNGRVGLAIVCPITSKRKGFRFEVPIPEGLRATGVVLADQARSVDWRARSVEFIDRLPNETVTEVLEKFGTLVRPG
jgi:mRNA interferase MazF